MTALDEKTFWLFLTRIPRVGAVTMRKLLTAFGTPKAIWDAPFSAFSSRGLPGELWERIQITKKTFNPDEELVALEKHACDIVTINDPFYPALLSEIPDAPVLLFYKGVWDAADHFAIAVVGTRKISPYGQQITESIVGELVEQGIPIVSGLALGIDTAAHEVCLRKKSRTVAVLGGGLDRIYPASNTNLAKMILANNGLLVSEYPIGMEPATYHFPQRNRIISGLTRGTIVMEADEKSGALITANYALDYNREVFAVPSTIYAETSRGCHNLIKQNRAKLITSGNDVLDELNLETTRTHLRNQEMLPTSTEEDTLLAALPTTATHIDELIRTAGLPAALVTSLLMTLSLKGRVRDLGNNHFQKC